MNRTLVALAAAAILAGCAVTQPKPPTLDMPAGNATAAQNALLERWWTAFDDPVLNKLIDEALASNFDLQSALFRIGAARSQLLLAQSFLAPDINLFVDPSRSRISSAVSPPLQPGSAVISNDFRIAVGMTYEIDVWGKYRAGALAAQNDLLASRYYNEVIRISVASDIASAYFRLRAADAELLVLKDTLKLRTDTVQLQRDRFEGGLIGVYDLRTAEAERSAVLADIARTQQAVELFESAIATLAGRTPREVYTPAVARGASIDAVTAVPALPDGLPTSLIERRPDIRRAEALLASSDLKVQQARADYFPSLKLDLFYGSQAAATGALFTGPATIWNLGLGLMQPLLALKAIESNVELAQAVSDRVVVEYAQTVQIAFREVHDALVVNRAAGAILAAETQRRDQIAEAYEVALLRYNAGRTSFLEVIDAQRTLLAAETLRIEAARDAKLSIVSFAKALGGGWSPEKFASAK